LVLAKLLLYVANATYNKERFELNVLCFVCCQ
jgi:hypothetical protein